MENTLCPLDGRYKNKIGDVTKIFGDSQLAKNKVIVEVEYFLFLMEKLGMKGIDTASAHSIYENFSDLDSKHILQIESVTKHDIKAVQEFVQNKLVGIGCSLEDAEFVHWGLTSQDIVSASYAMAVKDCDIIICRDIKKLEKACENVAISDGNKIMVAYTHGQPAIPTTFNRELAVFINRLKSITNTEFNISCKFGGAIGTLAGHYAIYDNISWDTEMDKFCIAHLDMSRSQMTTQTDNYQSVCHYLDRVRDMANILIDMSEDMWLYIFKGDIVIGSTKSETGSSTMPQKINPIKFESAQGNLELCSSMIEFFTRKLSKSRLQRDLSDSTLMRNLGMIFGYFALGIRSLIDAIKDIQPEVHFKYDIKIYSEYMQLYLKSRGYLNSYHIIKDMSRNHEDMTTLDVVTVLELHGIKQEHISEMVTNICGYGKTTNNKNFYLGNAGIK